MKTIIVFNETTREMSTFYSVFISELLGVKLPLPKAERHVIKIQKFYPPKLFAPLRVNSVSMYL